MHKILLWSGFGVAVRLWQLGIEMRPFFNRQSLWVYPVYAGLGGSVGYWLTGVEQRQVAFLNERREALLEKRRRRALREGITMKDEDSGTVEGLVDTVKSVVGSKADDKSSQGEEKDVPQSGVELTPEEERGKLGISEYAAKALGDVVYVELPSVGTEVAKGDAIGAVESVKSASDIMTPVAGTIIEANNLLEEKPATINKSPERDGWIAKIEIGSKVEIDSLMDKPAYDKFTGEQEADT
ncbi:MAG: hypothetical protein Q9159_003491 [Coniocarpon cinnabarinum]